MVEATEPDRPEQEPAEAQEPGPNDPSPPRDSPPGAGGAKGPAGIAMSGFREVFRIPDFRRLFWGQAVSALGDWVGTLAFIVAAQQLAPDQPAAVAAVLVLRLVPAMFATPIGGVLADRFNRKRIMIWSDLARFAIIFAVPFIPHLATLYVGAFVHECFSLVFLPARDASLPNVVGKERLEAANAIVMGSSFGGIPLSGPIFAGLAWIGLHYPVWLPFDRAIRAHSFAFAFIFDAFTFIISAIMIWRLSLPSSRLAAGKAHAPFLQSLGEGLRYIKNSPFIRGLAYAVGVAMLGGGVLFALGIGYVRETLCDRSPECGTVGFGWLMGLFGAGMVIGFALSQLKPERGVTWMIRGSLVAMGGVLIFMALVSVLWIGYVLALVFGAAFSLSLILGMSATQAATDDAHRGRVMAAVHMLVRGMLSVGALASGGIAAAIPERGIDLPLAPRLDQNQVALAIAGGLIVLGTLGVRSAERARAD